MIYFIYKTVKPLHLKKFTNNKKYVPLFQVILALPLVEEQIFEKALLEGE